MSRKWGDDQPDDSFSDAYIEQAKRIQILTEALRSIQRTTDTIYRRADNLCQEFVASAFYDDFEFFRSRAKWIQYELDKVKQ